MKKLVLITSLVAALAGANSAHATQFVTNGNFTTLPHGVGNLNSITATGWTNAGYNFVMTSATAGSGGVKLWDAANVNSGDTNTWNGLAPSTPTPVGNFAALDGDYENGPIAQKITGLTVGKTYTLSFDYAFAQQKNYSGATVQNLVMNFGAAGVKGSGDHPYTFAGGPTWTSADYDLPSHGFSGWKTYTTTVKATSTSEVLSFLALGNLPVPPFALVTDISLTGGSAVPEPATWGMMIVGLGAMGMVARRRRRMLAIA